MSFEETLAVLHAWLGQELEVAIQSADGMPIANIAGELAVGSDLSARDNHGPIYFQVGGVGATGFFIGERDPPRLEGRR